MSVETIEDAVGACKISMAQYVEEPSVVCYGAVDDETEELLHLLPGMKNIQVHKIGIPDLPEMEVDGVYGEVAMDKTEWKRFVKARVKEILRYKPEAVYVDGNVFTMYPVVHALRKKHIPVLTRIEKNGKKLLIRIPSGS